MAKFSTVQVSSPSSFAYTPPARIYGAVRVLVVANHISPKTLAAVLRGLWRYTPLTRVLVAEHESLAPDMMNDQMRSVDFSTLPMRVYKNRAPQAKVTTLSAPTLLAEVDACIALNTLTPDDLNTPPSLAVLGDLVNEWVDAVDAYYALGHLFAGSLVDTGEKLVWGDDLISVDTTAYRTAGYAPAASLASLKTMA